MEKVRAIGLPVPRHDASKACSLALGAQSYTHWHDLAPFPARDQLESMLSETLGRWYLLIQEQGGTNNRHTSLPSYIGHKIPTKPVHNFFNSQDMHRKKTPKTPIKSGTKGNYPQHESVRKVWVSCA